MDKLTPEWAMEVLRKHGREVTIEQAAAILDFLRKMATIAVAQYLRDKEDDLKKTG
jgi:hypothetical protein